MNVKTLGTDMQIKYRGYFLQVICDDFVCTTYLVHCDVCAKMEICLNSWLFRWTTSSGNLQLSQLRSAYLL